MDPEGGTGGLDPEGGTGGLDPSGKSQVTICFLRNTGTDPLGPIASRGRFVWPSVKYFDN